MKKQLFLICCLFSINLILNAAQSSQQASVFAHASSDAMASAASCSTDPVAKLMPERPIRSLADMCRNAITANHADTVNAHEILKSKESVEAERIFEIHINKALLLRRNIPAFELELGGRVTALTFSPNDKLLVFSSRYKIFLYDTEKYQQLLSIDLPYRRHIYELAFSPDNTLIACKADGIGTFSHSYIYMIDAASGEYQLLHKSSFNLGSNLVFSPDGKILNIGAKGSEHFFVDIQKKELFTIKNDHLKDRLCADGSIDQDGLAFDPSPVAFSPDGKIFAASTSAGNIVLMDLDTQKSVGRLEHEGPIQLFTFESEGKAIRSISNEGYERIWNIANQTCIHISKVIVPDHNIGDPYFFPNNTVIHIDQENYRLNIYDKHDGKQLMQLRTSGYYNPTYNHNNSMLALGSCRSIELHKLNYFEDLRKITDPNEQRFLLAAAPDWLNNTPHRVANDNQCYQSLITRFPFLNTPILFDAVQPERTPQRPICSSSVIPRTQARDLSHAQSAQAEAMQIQEAIPAQPAPTFWQRYRTPIIATAIAGSACAIGTYLYYTFYKNKNI